MPQFGNNETATKSTWFSQCYLRDSSTLSCTPQLWYISINLHKHGITLDKVYKPASSWFLCINPVTYISGANTPFEELQFPWTTCTQVFCYHIGLFCGVLRQCKPGWGSEADCARCHFPVLSRITALPQSRIQNSFLSHSPPHLIFLWLVSPHCIHLSLIHI